MKAGAGRVSINQRMMIMMTTTAMIIIIIFLGVIIFFGIPRGFGAGGFTGKCSLFSGAMRSVRCVISVLELMGAAADR